MKGKAIIPLVLGLCVGLVAVKFLFDTLQKAKGANAERKLVPIVRARQDIDSFEIITPDLVEVVETADTGLAPSAEWVSSVDDLLGRVTAKSIPKHSPVFNSMLAPEGTPAGMVGRIPSGFRAVSVKIDEVTGVAYQLKPGSWVDVIVVMDIDTGRGRQKETIAEVILENVQVAAIGQATDAANAETGAKVKPAKSATLLVREEDVPKLHLVQTRGKITLSMRGEDDKSVGTLAKARSTEVFGYEGEEPNQTQTVVTPATVVQTVQSQVQKQPEPPIDPPHNVTVYLGSPTNTDPAVQQLTFENTHSRTLLALSAGPVNRSTTLSGRHYGSTGSGRGSPVATGGNTTSAAPTGGNTTSAATTGGDTTPSEGPMEDDETVNQETE